MPVIVPEIVGIGLDVVGHAIRQAADEDHYRSRPIGGRRLRLHRLLPWRRRHRLASAVPGRVASLVVSIHLLPAAIDDPGMGADMDQRGALPSAGAIARGSGGG